MTVTADPLRMKPKSLVEYVPYLKRRVGSEEIPLYVLFGTREQRDAARIS